MVRCVWLERSDGVSVFVRAAPGSRNEGCDGLFADAGGKVHLKVRTRAVAEGGRANEAIVAILADMLGVPKSRISLATGATARLKTFDVGGDTQELAQRLRTIVSGLA